jgi:outer membrane protein OmpA-like peptidoglycan-associated protein
MTGGLASLLPHRTDRAARSRSTSKQRIIEGRCDIGAARWAAFAGSRAEQSPILGTGCAGAARRAHRLRWLPAVATGNAARRTPRYARRVRYLALVFLVARAAAAEPAPIKVAYDADHLDLDRRILQFKPSRAIAEATLVVIGEDGAELGKGSASYAGEPGAGWLAITWSQPAETRAMMLRLRVAAADGAATNVELIPWSVTVSHEDVSFSSDSAVIEPAETRKLAASLAQIDGIVNRAGRFIKLKLYIAGHTDTVGPPDKNRRLSLARAVAIGRYLRSNGLAIPIAVAGYGEDVLKVKTPDNTDERANRRADYVLGPAAGAPPFKGAYLKARAGWRPLE